MEFMPSGSLLSFIAKNRNMKWKDRYQMMIDICEGMAYLHSPETADGSPKVEVFHQDLKSGNILLTMQHGSLRGKISDFGLSNLRDLSKMSSSQLSSKVDMIGGTLAYKAPELYSRNAKVDLYNYPSSQKNVTFTLLV